MAGMRSVSARTTVISGGVFLLRAGFATRSSTTSGAIGVLEGRTTRFAGKSAWGREVDTGLFLHAAAVLIISLIFLNWRKP